MRGEVITKRNLNLRNGKAQLIASGEALEISGEFTVEKDSVATIRLHAGSSVTSIGYDAATAKLFIDRTQSGQVEFDPKFAGRHEASLQPQQGKVKLHVFMDRSSVEVFGSDGEVVLTDRIFPASNTQQIELQGTGTNTKCLSLNIWQLKSAWR